MKTAIATHKEQQVRTRILVVDDESSMCEFLRIMLGKEGYAVKPTPRLTRQYPSSNKAFPIRARDLTWLSLI